MNTPRIIRRVVPPTRRVRHDTTNARAARTVRHIRLMRVAGLVGKKRRGRLPKQLIPTTIEREYANALARYAEIVRKAFGPFLAELPALMESANRDRTAALKTDAGEGRRIRELIEQAQTNIRSSITTGDLEKLAVAFAERTATWQRKEMSKQVTAALGADVFLADRQLKPLTEAFVNANVGLIKNIGDKTAFDVEAATMRAIQAGTLHGDLTKELEARFDFNESRAALIARDQIGKAYGQINAARHRELGVDRFIWRTVGDERVRDDHSDRDGVEYSYNDPPEGELPGEPINCRCYADPVFDTFEDAATEAADETSSTRA